MKFLRTLVGYRFIDHKYDSDFQSIIKCMPLGSNIQHRKRYWYEPVLMTKDVLFPYITGLVQYKFTGQRNVDFPEVWWNEVSWRRNKPKGLEIVEDDELQTLSWCEIKNVLKKSRLFSHCVWGGDCNCGTRAFCVAPVISGSDSLWAWLKTLCMP
jgi:hypothetical protein